MKAQNAGEGVTTRLQVHLRKHPMPSLIWIQGCATWIPRCAETLKTPSITLVSCFNLFCLLRHREIPPAVLQRSIRLGMLLPMSPHIFKQRHLMSSKQSDVVLNCSRECTQTCAGPCSIELIQTAFRSMAGPLCDFKRRRCT